MVSDIYALKDIAEEYKNDPVAVAECWAGAETKDKYLQILKKAGFHEITVLEESAPYEKGQAIVSSFTISGFKTKSNKLSEPNHCWNA